MGIYANSALSPDDDAFKSPLAQIPEGLGLIGNDIGRDMSGLYDQAATAGSQGLGLLKQGLDAVTPSQDTMFRVFNAMEAGGYPGARFQQMQAEQGLMQQKQMMEYRRQQLAQQLQQQQLLKQQKDEDQALGIWKDQNIPMATKKKLSQHMAAQGNVLAGNLMRLGDEQLIAEMGTLSQFLPQGKAEELGKLMTQPNADLAPVEQWINYAREKKKAVGEAQFKSQRFSDLLQQHQQSPLDPSSPEFDELNTMVNERAKKQQEAQELTLKLQQMGLANKSAALKLPYEIAGLAADTGLKQNAPKEVASGAIGENQQFTDVYNPQTGKTQRIIGTKAPLVQNNIDTKGETKYTGQFAEKTANEDVEMLNAARQAPENYKRADRILDLLKNTSTITGLGAEWRLQFAKALKFAGLAGDDSAQNTETLFTDIADQTLAAVKQSGLGSGNGFSNTDRDYLEKAKGGRLSLEKESMEKLANISKRVAELTANKWNERVQNIPESALKSTGLTRDPIHVKPPDAPVVKSDADFNNLPSGTVFIGPDGKKRRKP